jgi:hypothetical protein
MCPDYWIFSDHAMAEGDTSLVTGEDGGTIDGESWRTPAAWKVVIRNNKVAEWRVFADNKPVYEILKKRQRPAILSLESAVTHHQVAQNARHAFTCYPVARDPILTWNGSALPPLFTVRWVHQRHLLVEVPRPSNWPVFSSDLTPERLSS